MHQHIANSQGRHDQLLICQHNSVHSKVGRLKPDLFLRPIDHWSTAQTHQLHGAGPRGRQRPLQAGVSGVGAPLGGQHLPLQLLLTKLLCHQRGLLQGV